MQITQFLKCYYSIGQALTEMSGETENTKNVELLKDGCLARTHSLADIHLQIGVLAKRQASTAGLGNPGMLTKS